MKADPRQGWPQALIAAGFRPGGAALLILPRSETETAEALDQAVHEIKGCSIPLGMGGRDQQVEVLRDLGAAALIGAADDLSTMADTLERMGLEPAKDLNVEIGLVVDGPIGAARRKEIETRLKTVVRCGIAAPNAGCLGFECSEMTGFHLTDNLTVDIVDPATGRSLPPGEKGSVLVLISTSDGGVKRSATGLQGCYSDEPCPCGLTSRRLFDLAKTDLPDSLEPESFKK